MFTHLKVHTEYSLQDSTLRIQDAVQQAQAWGMTHLAITDHGNMYGAFAFEKVCQAAGITPIFGVDLLVKSVEGLYSLTLLAETQTGLTHLMQLVTLANTSEKVQDVPQIPEAMLEGHTEGIIALDGGMTGTITACLLQGKVDQAREVARRYRERFGENSFFLEITNHGSPEEKRITPLLLAIAQEYHLRLVATNDVHYLLPAHAYARSIFNQLQGDEPPVWESHTYYSDQFHFASPEEMRQRFLSCSGALVATEEIASRCHGVTIHRERALPDFPVPAGETIESYFEKVTWQGFHERFPHPSKEYEDRLRFEITTIKQMGFPAYFLIVWDFIAYARKVGIPVGPGRGSAAGSLVAYALHITDRLDPIANHLFFERFLNPERVSMPDIDVDFDFERRHEMVAYVQQKYGFEHVAQIVTFGTMGAKMVIRDLGRVLGFSFQETDQMTKEFTDESLQDVRELPFFQEKLAKDPRMVQLFEVGAVLEGLPRHTSMHAAGVVISRLPLGTYLPLKEEDGVLITQWDKDQVEEIGLLKMDFLGLKTLSVLKHTYRNIEETTGKHWVPEEIPMVDDLTFQMLQEGKTGRVFQLESGGMQRTLREMKPERFEDLVAILALYRPGPMEFIPDYIRNKEQGTFQVPHPSLEPILRPSHGIMVYQEQIMQVAQTLAGYTLGEADILRRAVGKKKKEIIDNERDRFVAQAIARGVGEKVAHQVYDLIVRFANYGFNKSHAAAYAITTWDTAYMRAHYPVEFLAGNLTVAIGDTEKMRSILTECRRMGIQVLPPRLGVSRDIFSVEILPNGEKAIRYGLAGIRNVGRTFAQALMEAPAYPSLYDYLRHISGHLYTKQSWENLIAAGACDHLGNRGTHFHHLGALLQLAREVQDLEQRGQMSFLETSPAPALAIQPDPPQMELLKEERRVLEITLSGHPIDPCLDLLTPFVTANLSDLNETFHKQDVVVGGIFNSIKRITTKKGAPMAFGMLEDESHEIEVILFPQVYEKVKTSLKEFVPFFVSGRVEWDTKEQRCKLLMNDLRPVLTGRQVVYIKVKDEAHAQSLTQRLTQSNGVTSVVYVQGLTLTKQPFQIRWNPTTIHSLDHEEYHWVTTP